MTPKSRGTAWPGDIMRRRSGSAKVAFFAPTMTWGGAEKMFRRLAVGLSEEGLNVDLILARAIGPNLEGLPREITTVDLGCDRVLSSVVPLASYLRGARPDVLISTLHYANIAAVWARLFAAVPIQLILREANTLSVEMGHSRERRDRAILEAAKRSYPRADVVVANSLGVADDLVCNVGLARSKVRVIYNPTYNQELLPLMRERPQHPWFRDGGPPVLVSAGRFNQQKRLDLLIRAVARGRQTRDLRLVLLGDGEERPRLEAIVAQLGAQDYVSMPGFVSNPYSFMAHAQLFVLSSDWEGLPNALIEALACGLPVVATDCPSGPREILRANSHGPGPVGTLVRMGDVDALSDAIIQELDICRNKDELKRSARRFDSARAVRAYSDLVYRGEL